MMFSLELCRRIHLLFCEAKCFDCSSFSIIVCPALCLHYPLRQQLGLGFWDVLGRLRGQKLHFQFIQNESDLKQQNSCCIFDNHNWWSRNILTFWFWLQTRNLRFLVEKVQGLTSSSAAKNRFRTLIDAHVFFYLIKPEHLLGALLCNIKPCLLASDATKQKWTQGELNNFFFKYTAGVQPP